MRQIPEHLRCSIRGLRLKNALASSVFIAIFLAPLGSLRADHTTTIIRSVEWLVDNSEQIVIVKHDESSLGKFEVLHRVKGTANSLTGPIKKDERIGYPYLDAYSGELFSLLFLNKKQQLLAQIGLARKWNGDMGWKKSFYGVDQFGNLLLSESTLMRAIENRLTTSSGPRLPYIENSVFYPSKTTGVFVYVPNGFPLNNADETHFLEVPFDAKRRDYYLSKLTSGTAAARINAISELSRFKDDKKSAAAISRATTVDDVMPSFGDLRWTRIVDVDSLSLLNSEDVRQAAKQALESSRRSRRGHP